MTDNDSQKEARTGLTSDRELLARVREGDREAFAQLYDRYGDAAYSLAVRIVRDRDLAADVVQDAFLAVWKNAASFDPDRGQASTWILTMTHNKAVDLVRREQRRRADQLDPAHDAPSGDPPPDQLAYLSAARGQIREAMAKLPAAHREVIELAYFGGYTQSELAEMLSVPMGTIKSRSFAALKALRAALEETGWTGEDQWTTTSTS
jgi:RNA polymerase sigma-70 factor (ECF subfamily)